MSRGKWLVETVVSAKTKRECLYVTMNSSKANVINPAWQNSFDELLTHVEAQVANRKALPLVISGEATSAIFSAGLDLQYLFAHEDRSKSKALLADTLDRFGASVLRLQRLPVPTVAAISGHALAGGAILAAACDFRVGFNGGEKSARFGAIEVSVGVPFPAWAFALMKNIVPREMRSDAILYGSSYTAEEAAKMGMFSALSADKESLKELAVSLATRLDVGSGAAFALAKELMVEETQRYCRDNGERVMQKVMQVVYSDEGWKHLQKSLSSLKK